jgi:hypothetical protein
VVKGPYLTYFPKICADPFGHGKASSLGPHPRRAGWAFDIHMTNGRKVHGTSEGIDPIKLTTN